MSAQPLPFAIFTHVLSFLEPNELPLLTEVSKDWHTGTIHRIRICAAASLQHFAAFLHQSNALCEHFFNKHVAADCLTDIHRFTKCNSLREIQPIAEEMRYRIEEELSKTLNDDEIKRLARRSNTFNYGFEKIFFLLNVSRKIDNLTQNAQWGYAHENHIQSYRQQLLQVIQILITQHCGTRALRIMNENPLLAGHDHWRKENDSTRVEVRARCYIAAAAGFVTRGDFPAAIQLINNLPLYLGLDPADIRDPAKKEEMFEAARNKVREDVFETVAAQMMCKRQYDEARAMIVNIRDPIKLRQFEKWFSSLRKPGLM